MIYIERKITIKKNQAKIEQPIVLYKGDANIKLKFSIENNPFKHASGVDALYGRLVIKRPNTNPIFSEPVKMSESRVIFTVTGDMIDGLDAEGNPADELGAYDFQIQLLNSESISEETSIGSLPEVTGGIIIKKPLCEGAAANVARINDSYVMPGNDNISTFSLRDSNNTFDEDGNYIKTNWAGGDIITDTRLNKVESALYEINENIITTYASRDFVDDMIDANNNELDDKYMKAEAIDNYATKEEVTESINGIVGDFATQDFVNDAISSNNDNLDDRYATQDYVDQAIENIEGIAGPQGPQGEQGPMGPQGPQGEPGKDADPVDLDGYATKEYVNNAIENIEIPEVGNELPIRVIGNGPDAEPYILTGNEFTDEEYENYWEGSVYFNNVSIMDNTFNDLFTVSLCYWDKNDDGVMYKDIYIESAYSGGHEFDIHPYTGVIEESWHDYFAYREDLEAYATQDYVDNAISNIEISGGESECSLKVIGRSDSEEPHIFTGDEFTDEEWSRSGYYAVLFNNTAINEWIVNGLCDVYLAGRGLIYIWSPRLGFHEYWKDDDIWVEAYSYQYATTSELEDIRDSVNGCATKDELQEALGDIEALLRGI